MRKIILALVFVLVNVTLHAQNLTIAQLIEIQKKDLGHAEEFLTAKGWAFLEAQAPTDGKLASATFTYNKSVTSSVAEAFLTFRYSNNPDLTWVSIQISEISKYNEYVNSIKAYGCKLISSEIENGRILKIYRGATTTFLVESGTTTNFFDEETPTWHIWVIPNTDYDLIWKDK